MKLKLTTKPNKESNKDPLVIMVQYGPSEDHNGNKIKLKKHIEKVNVGCVIEVDDILGAAIQNRYPGCFEVGSFRETKEAVSSGVKI